MQQIFVWLGFIIFIHFAKSSGVFIEMFSDPRVKDGVGVSRIDFGEFIICR